MSLPETERAIEGILADNWFKDQTAITMEMALRDLVAHVINDHQSLLSNVTDHARCDQHRKIAMAARKPVMVEPIKRRN